MATDGKKISFGFMKTSKFSGPMKQVPQKKETIQYIDCLDSKNIVCKKNDEEQHTVQASDLIIPMKRKELNGCEEPNKKTNIESGGTVKEDNVHSDSLEERAVKEILEDSKQRGENKEASASSIITMKYKTKAEPSTEATLDDYEQVPIEHYGLAMLRGMGWKAEKGIGKNEKIVSANVPQLRPRGLGLGASISPQVQKPASSKGEEELKAIKGAYVQIISGSQKGKYGQIEGFNDDSGRVIIKLSLNSSTVLVNECAFQLVTKDDYNKNSRVLNVSKYEDYKQKSERSHFEKSDRSEKRHRSPTETKNSKHRYNK